MPVALGGHWNVAMRGLALATDLDHNSDQVAARLGEMIDEVLPARHHRIDGSLKKLFNNAEADITRWLTEKATKVCELEASGRRSGAYSNPLGSGGGIKGGVLGDSGLTPSDLERGTNAETICQGIWLG